MPLLLKEGSVFSHGKFRELYLRWWWWSVRSIDGWMHVARQTNPHLEGCEGEEKGISFCDVILAPGCDAFLSCKGYENIGGAWQEREYIRKEVCISVVLNRKVTSLRAVAFRILFGCGKRDSSGYTEFCRIETHVLKSPYRASPSPVQQSLQAGENDCLIPSAVLPVHIR